MKMRTILALAVTLSLLIGVVAMASSPTYTANWDGRRGTDSERCGLVGQEGRPATGWIHWVFSTKGASTDARLILGGTGSGTYAPGGPLTANVWHFYTPYFDLNGLTATIELYGGARGPGGGLVISDYCPGVFAPQGEVQVIKTAHTTYTREHLWDIDKSVETRQLYEDYPKIWLYADGSGDETATWVVNVMYDGYKDKDFAVSGSIYVKNTGDIPARVDSVTDYIETSQDIHVTVNCPTLPATLQPGEKLECSYRSTLPDKTPGTNFANASGVFLYPNDTVFGTFDKQGTAAITFGDPTTEVHKTVTIKDYSDLLGEKTLGTATAPNGNKFTYNKPFAWVDYGVQGGGSYTYNNKATIVETGRSASAALKVNVIVEKLVERLDVSKTAVTSYTREHFWGIDKYVETQNGHTLNGTPKIWLYSDGSGDETATWTVDVTCAGFEDSGFNVSGDITIENTGDLDAVIKSVADVLAGQQVDVKCGVGFPYTLLVGETLTCTYSENVASKITGYNVVTVTTERDTYSANKAIVWGAPTTEANKTVTIKDYSDLFGEKTLGTATAPNSNKFTYDKTFAWVDYGVQGGGSYTYNNKATIVETGQSASATLKVNVPVEKLDVAKTAVISYIRTHNWDIDKSVDPEIWLYIDGRNDGSIATWTVDVAYKGSEDSDHMVSGRIRIQNSGTLSAKIESVLDTLFYIPEDQSSENEAVVDVQCGVTFPYELEVGQTLNCTYSFALTDKATGINTVTVTTERDQYQASKALPAWGEPTREVNKTVIISDVSKLFGTKTLGTVMAPNSQKFTYDKSFAWADYGKDACGPYTYGNTAKIYGDNRVVLGEASATLKVNVQCYIYTYETAYAKGDGAKCFIPTFRNWGWTNPLPNSWMPLYAGAAHCDPNRGILVGYTDDWGNLELLSPYKEGKVHVYRGTTEFPQVQRGRWTFSTVAPGQYYIEDGAEWVIVHAEVGIPTPDPNFGRRARISIPDPNLGRLAWIVR